MRTPNINQINTIMAKYQIKAALLAPSGNYDETTDPKAVADFKALDKAYE